MKFILAVTLLVLVAFCAQANAGFESLTGGMGQVSSFPGASGLGSMGGGKGGGSTRAQRVSSQQFYNPRDGYHYVRNSYSAQGQPQNRDLLEINPKYLGGVLAKVNDGGKGY